MDELIDAHLTHLQAQGMSPRTIQDRRRLIRAADRDMPYGIVSATREEIEAYLGAYQNGWTKHTYYEHLAGFYAWAFAGDDPWIIGRNPMLDMRPPKTPEQVPHPVTETELTIALERSNVRWQQIILLAAEAGLRVSEIAALERHNVTAKSIRVVAGKGNRDAYVRNTPRIWQLIAPMPDGLLFPSQTTGRTMARGVLSSVARKHFDRIGLPRVTLHRFRHRYCTRLVAKGIDVTSVRVMARHKNLNTTQGYVLVSGRQLDAAVAALSEIGDAA